ncbi:MAG TPA: haloacid dehalogenase type II [Rubrobacteraceae bacterium]|nr:haloacid dehalogenase type II [Rubrobacteraceae bacterium]
MSRVCVFDVNETLLDLAALDPHFERAFGDASVRQQWFMQMLQSTFVATITDAYATFGEIGVAALQMTAERQGITISDEDRQSILGGMRELPPHPEVSEALDRLRDAGIRLAALTNSTPEVAEAQLNHAGLAEKFERILSADTAKRLKPAAAPYRMAARSLGIDIRELRLVAAHAWDVAGAMRAGCAAAFVARQPFDPLVEKPDVVGADLAEVADGIIAAET